jgi:hypothetical protein
METWTAQMRENVGVGTAGILQGVREDRQVIKGALGVDRLSEPEDGAVIRCKDDRVDPRGPKRVAHKLA